jgi:hypothetical protein
MHTNDCQIFYKVDYGIWLALRNLLNLKDLIFKERYLLLFFDQSNTTCLC